MQAFRFVFCFVPICLLFCSPRDAGRVAGSQLVHRVRDTEVKVVCTDGPSVFSGAQVLLLSQDYGKHLLGVEDLLQKHALVEADIGIQAERVRGVNASAQKFATDGEGKNGLW